MDTSEKIYANKNNNNNRPIIIISHLNLSKNVDQWVNYVQGKNNPSKPKTIISKTCKEPAKNKPAVRAMVEGLHKSILFDSGCVTNVVDYGFVKKAQSINRNLILENKIGAL